MSNLQLRCWLRTESFDVFDIDISPHANICTLKELVFQKKPFTSRWSSTTSLEVYKVPEDKPIFTDDSFEEKFGSLSISAFGTPLDATEEMSSIFTSLPLSVGHLHLVIDLSSVLITFGWRGATPGLATTLDFRSGCHIFHDETVGHLKASIKDKEQLADIPLSHLTLYKISHRDDKLTEYLDATGVGEELNEGDLVRTVFADVPFCGRPRVIVERLCAPTPPIILHPVFGDFINDCQAIETTSADYALANDLANKMSVVNDDEAVRLAGIEEIFQRYGIPFTVSKAETAEHEVNADGSTSGHRYVIVEFKKDLDRMSTEPYYLDPTKYSAVKFPSSSLPYFLLAVSGLQIQFAAATCYSRTTVQLLSTLLLNDSYHVVACHLAAFRKATRTLKQYYEELSETSHIVTPPVPFHPFPYPTTYASGNDILKRFRYEYKVYGDGRIYFGTELDGTNDRICVRFVQRYSRAAHEFFASSGCAPALRGFEELSGGWLMVVMDRLSDEFETIWSRASRRPPLLPIHVFADMCTNLDQFHDAGFVHGDIRDVNIMVSESDERFMFINFEWAGRKGEVRYPTIVEREGVTRLSSARSGRKIRTEHDVFMLKLLIEHFRLFF